MYLKIVFKFVAPNDLFRDGDHEVWLPKKIDPTQGYTQILSYPLAIPALKITIHKFKWLPIQFSLGIVGSVTAYQKID